MRSARPAAACGHRHRSLRSARGLRSDSGRSVPRYGVAVIEDAAEALGATPGRTAGSFGRIGVFSFNGNKIITTSGGGMLVSETARRSPRRGSWPLRRATRRRTTSIPRSATTTGSATCWPPSAARSWRRCRSGSPRDAASSTVRDAARRHSPGSTSCPRPVRPCESLAHVSHNRSGLFGASRETVRLALEAEDIEARPVWKPMHLQPVFRRCRARGGRVSEGLFERGLCLPSGSNLSDADLERITAIVRRQCRATETARPVPSAAAP